MDYRLEGSIDRRASWSRRLANSAFESKPAGPIEWPDMKNERDTSRKEEHVTSRSSRKGGKWENRVLNPTLR